LIYPVSGCVKKERIEGAAGIETGARGCVETGRTLARSHLSLTRPEDEHTQCAHETAPTPTTAKPSSCRWRNPESYSPESGAILCGLAGCN